MAPVGCVECRMTGYRGRIGLYEVMLMTPAIRKLVTTEADDSAIREQAYKDGMKPLRVSGAMKVAAGWTTADEVVLPGATAYITDVGMTGPHDSVIGRRTDRVIEALLTQMPTRFEVATGDVRLNAVLIEADAESGRARSIRRVALRLEGPVEEEGPAAAGARQPDAGAQEVVGAP
jgi:hypothetical protein